MLLRVMDSHGSVMEGYGVLLDVIILMTRLLRIIGKSTLIIVYRIISIEFCIHSEC